jgi:hypothetical protein
MSNEIKTFTKDHFYPERTSVLPLSPVRWIAHALEAYGSSRPLRPRAVYTGRAREQA